MQNAECKVQNCLVRYVGGLLFFVSINLSVVNAARGVTFVACDKSNQKHAFISDDANYIRLKA